MSTARANDEVRRLLNEYVPEVTSGAVQIMGIARETGQRAMIAVHAPDPDVCPVSLCIGPQGSRIKAVVKALPGDQIDVIRWSDSLEEFLRNLLAPVQLEGITLDAASRRATIAVAAISAAKWTEDGGLRLRLVSRLAGRNLQFIQT